VSRKWVQELILVLVIAAVIAVLMLWGAAWISQFNTIHLGVI
jgi:hypothetical protein